MCIEIYAHCENDYEVTLGGNGVNSSEAALVANRILHILEVAQNSLLARVNRRTKALRKEHNDDE